MERIQEQIKTLANKTDEEMFEMFRAIEEKATIVKIKEVKESLPVDQRDNPNLDLELKSYLLKETNIWGIN